MAALAEDPNRMVIGEPDELDPVPSAPDTPMSGTAFAGVCALLALSCIFLGAAISYIIFGIIFLVEDRNICGDYQDRSEMWIYGVVVLGGVPAFICMSNLVLLKSDPVGSVKVRLAIALVASMTIVVFGLLVLYSEQVCEDLKHTGLYIWVNVTVYFQLFIFLLTLGAYLFYTDYLEGLAKIKADKALSERSVEPVQQPQEQGESQPLLPREGQDLL